MSEKVIRNQFAEKIIMVTGVTRAGKSMLSPIIGSLAGVEPVHISMMTEQYPMLHNLGLMSEEVAVYLLRYAMDFVLTDGFVGRGLNFRADDASSIWKTGDPEKYFRRLTGPEGDCIVDQIRKEDPSIVFNVHYALWHINIYLKAFPKLRMLQVRRHPIDVIHSWFLKGYGRAFTENPRNGMLTLTGKNQHIPYYASEWKDLFESLPEMDRIIEAISFMERVHADKLNALSEFQRKQVKVILFEDMVTQTDSNMTEICDFLDLCPTKYTASVLLQERCPRIIDKSIRDVKYKEICSLSSKEAINKLNKLIEDYKEAPLY